MGARRLLRGCGVALALVVILIVALSVWVLRKPEVRDMMTCREHMTELADALTRYRDVHGSYPESLQVLEDEYLKDASVLRCPLDRTSGGKPSYAYHRPEPGSPDDFVVLECKRHRLQSDMPNIRLVIQKDGTFKAIGPTFKETLRQQKHRNQ